MTEPFSDTLGVDDAVRIELGGEAILIAESWNIRESVLSQPAQWSVTVGWGDVAASLIKKWPPRTPFKLYVGDALQFQGMTDGIIARQSAGGATTIEIRGRDGLAPIHDSYVKRTVGIAVATYAQLVWFALGEVGILGSYGLPKNSSVTKEVLSFDNAANREIKGGVPITQILPHRTEQQILDDAGLTGPNVGICHTNPQARLNETWHQLLRRYLDRAGLMLWARAGGGYILSAPNSRQQPTYRLQRNTGDPNAGANVISASFEQDATHRHSEAIIYGRGGGKILGRVKAKGNFLDIEMSNKPTDDPPGFGYDQPIVFRDAHCSSIAEASYFARRKIAEERRGGWKLEYTIAGHSLPFLGGSGTDRAVLVPDTIVSVEDHEFGLKDNYYIEGVERRRGPETTTTIRLMRVDDLVFGGPGDE